MPGQIIIVSGTSGAGKSTACELFARRSDGFWLLYGIDHFLANTYPAKFGHHGARCREGIYAEPAKETDPEGALRWRFGKYGTRAFAVFHEWIAAAAAQGCNIIVDHLMMLDPPVLQDAIWRLQGLPVHFVNLRPPFEVLMERVTNRKIDKKLPTDILGEQAIHKIIQRLDRLRPWFYESVYDNSIYDLEIDTVENSPEAVCDLIEARLLKSPGSAFEELRAKYPRNSA